MAYKDEYEVAQLYSAPAFRRALEDQFEGKLKLAYHLAPPALDRKGARRKRRFGPWMEVGFHVLARLKFLRGTPFDPFGRTEERRAERGLVAEYRRRVESELISLSRDTLDRAIQVARVTEGIRGFGHVKTAAIERARAEWLQRQPEAF